MESLKMLEEQKKILEKKIFELSLIELKLRVPEGYELQIDFQKAKVGDEVHDISDGRDGVIVAIEPNDELPLKVKLYFDGKLSNYIDCYGMDGSNRYYFPVLYWRSGKMIAPFRLVKIKKDSHGTHRIKRKKK